MSEPTTAPQDGWPVFHDDFRQHRPAFTTYERLNELRAESPFLWGTVPEGYWMVTRYDHVREALQTPQVFSNQTTTVLGDRTSHLRLIPQHLDGREHVECRHVINPWFSPISVRRIEDLARQRCAEMIDELRPAGRCDLTHEFAMAYATEMFLAMLGLPVSDGEFFLPRVEVIFAGFFGGDQTAMTQAADEIRAYFDDLIEDRLVAPRDVSDDFVTFLLQSKMGDQPISRDDALTLCTTIMLGGLDTTRSALGYILWHLATHDDDRHALVEHPELIPEAVEEFVRLYALVFQDGRMVTEDVDFHGCPMKAGDVVWLGLAQANRDPDRFEDPDAFRLGRRFTKHMGFGLGAHRCLGAHLARLELITALEEWLTRIPEFHLDTDTPLMERGGQLMLFSVPLAWQV